MTERCEKRMMRGFHSHRCSRRGVVEEKGRRWCRQHAPSAVADRRTVREERDRAEWARRSARIERLSARSLIATAAIQFVDRECGIEDLRRVVEKNREVAR